MIARVIQQKVLLGQRVRFSLKNGHQICGLLTEIAKDYITVENADGPATTFVDQIASWEVLHADVPFPEVGESKKVVEAASDAHTNNLPQSDGNTTTRVHSDLTATNTSEQHPSNNGSGDSETRGRPDVINPAEQEEVRTQALAEIPSAAWRKVIEVEATYNAQIRSARIEAREPDFEAVSSGVIWRKPDGGSAWNRIKSQFAYAKRVNELSAKFGRVQPVVVQLTSLVESYPDSSLLKRCLAYCYSSLDSSYSREKSIHLYHQTALTSGDAGDWLSVAAVASQAKKDELACHALEQFFGSSRLDHNLPPWYSYVGLVIRFGNFNGLQDLLESRGRVLAEEEIAVLFETAIFLLSTLREQQAALLLAQDWVLGKPLKILVKEALKHFDGSAPDSYKAAIQSALVPSVANAEPVNLNLKESGTYIQSRKVSGSVNSSSSSQTPPRPAVMKNRTSSAAENYREAVRHSSDPGKAITFIKKVLTQEPSFPGASQLYEKLRSQARMASIPIGSNPYARAKQAHLIDKNLDKAIDLYRNAVENNDHAESALKDLSHLLNQRGRYDETISTLDRHGSKVKDQFSLGTIYATAYFKAGKYDQAVKLLQERLRYSAETEKPPLMWNLANCYIRKEDFLSAEKTLTDLLKLQPNNTVTEQQLASCLSKQRKYDEAIQILNRVLDTSPNPKAIELLEAIRKAKATGEFAQLEEIGIEFGLTDFHVQLSDFTHFFLSRCVFENVNPERVKERNTLKFYEGSEKDAESDIRMLEEGARRFTGKVARTRADFLLSAARISLDVKQDYDLFYRYLCRSFASKGDAAVAENLALDTAREWYCESLNAYDGCLERFEGGERYDEQDAVNSLARFLFSSLGKSEIPKSAPRREREEKEFILEQQVRYINETLETVITRHLPTQRDKIFDAIAYVTLRSKYAAKRILNYIYSNQTFQLSALDYLKGKGIPAVVPPQGLDDFVGLWNLLRRRLFEKNRAVSSEFRGLSNVILTTAWLEDAIERVKDIVPKLLLRTDQERLQRIQTIYETALQLCREVLFEERERLCKKIEGECQDLLHDLQTSPTKLSVELLFPLVEIIQARVQEALADINEKSKPQIEIRLAKDSYPNISKLVEVQVVVANKIGLSPAESLTLTVHENEDMFVAASPEVNLGKSLRGDKKEFIVILLEITEKALEEKTFSLTLSGTYLTRTGELERTEPHSFSVKLYSEEDFHLISNPYYLYARGDIVGDPKMFYGRKQFIKSISTVIQQSKSQSKSVIIYGQKRAGKSSILYHIKQHLSLDQSLLVLDIGNIALFFEKEVEDNGTSIGMLNRLLWLVLRKLKDAIEDKVEDGFPQLEVSFPSMQEFAESLTPRMLFGEVFDRFKRMTSKATEWRDVRVVVLIDEFSYIHGQIISGDIPDTFPKYWKAILQANYFNAVLVGQDDTLKFFDRFQNEFASTEPERVTYLPAEDAVKLIDEPIHFPDSEGGGSRYRERAIDRVLQLTAGSPFYIQIFCKRLVEYMNSQRSPLITGNDVEQVKEQLLTGENRISATDFNNLINSGDTSPDAISDDDARKVLRAIALNSQTGPCNISSITCETQALLAEILNDLLRRDVIKREREGYEIHVGLFKEWLITNP
jgi:tetratricopeptide (TPR) repeat protein